MSDITFTMLKPDSIRNKNTGAIIDKIIKAGFVIKAMKFTRMSNDQASNFYAIHKERPFFKDLIEYMTSGPIVAAILEKDNAVFIPLGRIPQKISIKRLYRRDLSGCCVHKNESLYLTIK